MLFPATWHPAIQKNGYLRRPRLTFVLFDRSRRLVLPLPIRGNEGLRGPVGNHSRGNPADAIRGNHSARHRMKGPTMTTQNTINKMHDATVDSAGDGLLNKHQLALKLGISKRTVDAWMKRKR